MAAKLKILGLTLSSLMAVGAWADELGQKATTRINFNQMIDDTDAKKAQLQQEVTSRANETPTDQDAETASDKEKVTELVDAEIGVVEQKPVVVNRQINSVGEPRIDLLTTRLIAKRNLDKGS